MKVPLPANRESFGAATVFRRLQRSQCILGQNGYRPRLPTDRSKCANTGNSGRCTARSAGAGLIMH